MNDFESFIFSHRWSVSAVLSKHTMLDLYHTATYEPYSRRNVIATAAETRDIMYHSNNQNVCLKTLDVHSYLINPSNATQYFVKCSLCFWRCSSCCFCFTILVTSCIALTTYANATLDLTHLLVSVPSWPIYTTNNWCV